MASEKKRSPVDIEWEHRVLCSDESCIGVIGPDGRCKECGLAYEGVLPWEVGDGQAAEPSDMETDIETDTRLSEPEAAPADSAESSQVEGETTDDEWSRRVLCSDENCIGVIGPDGKCKECGKALI